MIAIDSDKSLNARQKGSEGHLVTPEPSSPCRHVDLWMFFALKRIRRRQKRKKLNYILKKKKKINVCLLHPRRSSPKKYRVFHVSESRAPGAA